MSTEAEAPVEAEVEVEVEAELEDQSADPEDAVDLRSDRGTYYADAHDLTPIVAVEFRDLTFFVDTADKKRDRAVFIRRRMGETRAMRRAVAGIEQVLPRRRAPQTLLDADAGTGSATVVALRQAGFARAIAFEAHPDRFRLLRLNIAVNGLSGSAVAIHAGIGDTVTRSTFRPQRRRLEPIPYGTPQPPKIRIPMTTLDALVADGRIDPQQLSLVWLGAQGDSAAIARGGTELLAAGVPFSLRVDHDKEARAILASLIADHGCWLVDLGASAKESDAVRGSELDALMAPYAKGKQPTRLLLVPRPRLGGIRPTGAAVPRDMDGGELANVGAQEHRHLVTSRLKTLVPITQPLLQISQPPRSGGTLLMRLLDGHPSCFTIPHELKINWSGVRDEQTLESIVDRERDEGFFVEGFKQTKSRSNNETRIFPVLLPPLLQEQIYDAMLADKPDPTPRDVMNAYFTSHLNGWLDYQSLYGDGKKWVVAFRPGNLGSGAHRAVSETFSDAYPDGRMITILRDPRGWFASARAWMQRFEPMEKNIADWLDSADRIEELQRDMGDRLTVLDFDTLVTRTEPLMRALADILEIPFSPSMLEPTFNRTPIGANSSFAMSQSGVSAEASERFREVLSPEELDAIESLAGERYRDLVERFALKP